MCVYLKPSDHLDNVIIEYIQQKFQTVLPSQLHSYCSEDGWPEYH
jgi:hypothetical protein